MVGTLENALVIGGSRRLGPIQTDRDYQRTRPVTFQVSIPYSDANDQVLLKNYMTCQQAADLMKAKIGEIFPGLEFEVKVTATPNWRKL